MGIPDEYEDVRVRACVECNSALGTRPPWTVAGRRRRAQAWIQRRYAEYLRIPEWDETDLAGLGRMLRNKITSDLAVQALTRRRIAYRPRVTYTLK